MLHSSIVFFKTCKYSGSGRLKVIEQGAFSEFPASPLVLDQLSRPLPRSLSDNTRAVLCMLLALHCKPLPGKSLKCQLSWCITALRVCELLTDLMSQPFDTPAIAEIQPFACSSEYFVTGSDVVVVGPSESVVGVQKLKM